MQLSEHADGIRQVFKAEQSAAGRKSLILRLQAKLAVFKAKGRTP